MYIAHLEPNRSQFSNVAVQLFFRQATLHAVSLLILIEEEPPPPRSTPWGVYRPAISHEAFTHTLAHGRQKYGGWACSDRPHMFFYVHQPHRHDSTQPGFFTSWVALCDLYSQFDSFISFFSVMSIVTHRHPLHYT